MIQGIVRPTWLQEHQSEVTIVDVRDPGPYADLGHIPTAVNIPYESVRNPAGGTAGHLPEPETVKELFENAGIEPTDTIVAYDDSPGVYAARVMLTAAAFGHDGDLYILDGGYDAWSGDHPVTTGSTDVTQSTYPVSEPGHPVVGKDRVEAAIEDDDAVLVDTRSAAEYEAAAIPDAVHVSWEDLVEDGRLRQREAVQSILAERGITPDRTIVLYCNTARRLSHTYAVLADLGYEDVYAYEGSLMEWIREAAPEWSPAELQRQVRAYADDGFEAMVDALGEGVIDRLKLVGLYHQKQRGYFMVRTRVPGGELTAEQARVIGAVADDYARAPPEHGGTEQNPEFGDGFLDITTRQDIQMHWVELADIPELWDRYEAVGLTTVQACGNSVRNVVACPAAGLDPDESANALPYVHAITDHFTGSERYANLPRKLKFAVTGCHENCARGDIQDVGFLPARKDGDFGFNVRIGGGLSDGPRRARDLDLFVRPDDVVAFTQAVADLFIDHGSYLDTAVNRLRYLVADWGVETVRAELAARTDFAFEPAGEDLTERYRGDHVGVHEQQGGKRYLGLNVPAGRIAGTEFMDIADIAATFGSDAVRLSPAQNALIPGVDPDDVETVLSQPVIETYSPDPGPFERGIIACTGKEFCTYGLINTKNRAVRWARELDEWITTEYEGPVPDVVRVHLSGCSASCAHPQLADFGLRGEERTTVEGTKPAVDVGLGGDLGQDRFVTWVAGSLPTAAFPAAAKQVLTAYAAADTDMAFSTWVERTSTDQLRELVTGATTTSASARSEADD